MTDYSKQFVKLATNLLHAGAPQPRLEGAVISPVFQSANFLMADETEYGDVRYLRLSNSPNHLSLQARLAVIDSGESALVTSSGMAAISSTLLTLLKGGGHMLAQKTLYGGTQRFLESEAREFGITCSAIDSRHAKCSEEWERCLRKDTRLVYLESVSNPLMEVADLRAVVKFSKEHGLLTVVDNTFLSPVNLCPLEIGADIVVHSATKYLNGHSDLVAGVVVGSAEQVDRIRHLQHYLGASLDPHACFLLERGLKTLEVRVERQNRTALKLAKFLSSASGVRRVNYPGLESDPGNVIARDLFRGFGGMLSFYCDDSDRAVKFLQSVHIPLHAASLGGVESLVVRPSRSSHLGFAEVERERLGIDDTLVRVSVGLEDPDELIDDFTQALQR